MKKIVLITIVLTSTVLTQAQCWQKVASKYGQTVAIHVDGSLWHWGGYLGTQRNRSEPVQLDASTDWVQVTAGNNFFGAIKLDGSLWTWGDNSYGALGDGTTTNHWAPVQLGTDMDWAQIDAGDGHMIAMKTDGSLWTWGRNDYGQMGLGTDRTHTYLPIQLGTDTDWSEISAGRYYSFGKKSDGSLFFVGAAFSGEASSLKQVGGTGEWKTMSGANYYGYGIKKDGSLWSWQHKNNEVFDLSQVDSATDWKKIKASFSGHILLIKENRTLWGYGSNAFGQLGDQTIDYRSEPVLISGVGMWTDLIAGFNYSMAIRSDYGFWAWGRNTFGQFGNGLNRNVLQAVDTVNTWTQVASGKTSLGSHTMAIRSDGTLWGWGRNSDGELGNGTTTASALPVQVGTDNDWKQVAVGFAFNVAVKNDGTLWTWGRNGRSQLGLGSAVLIFKKTTPTQVGTDTDWKMVSAGSEFALAVKNDGTLWSWGYNFDGQLGDGSTTERDAPIQIGTDTDWDQIATGNEHSLAIKKDSTLWSWGDRSDGQIGRPGGSQTIPGQVGTDKWIRIVGGGRHSLGIKADSTLWSWGYNLYGQLGDGTASGAASSPGQIGLGAKWIDIAAGYEQSLGLQVDQSLWGWGRNGAGQLADTVSYEDFLSEAPSPVAMNTDLKFVTMTGSVANTAAIAADGRLYTCGDGYSDQYSVSYPQLGYVHWEPKKINNCTYCDLPPYNADQTLCAGDSVYFAGSYIKTAGIYYDTIPKLEQGLGCDSIYRMELSFYAPLSGTEQHTVCGSYTWIDGNTYTSSTNTPTFTLTGANGCDSIVTLDLTILNPTSGTDVQSACGSYTWIDGNTYTSSTNTPTFTLIGANGCDSIVTLDLTILNPTSGTDVQSACGSYTWIDGNTYTSSTNAPTFTIIGSNGCDSIVTLDLTILNPTSGTDVQSACGSYTWIDGNTYTNSTDTPVFTLMGSNGCDSIVTLNLTITNIDLTVNQTDSTLMAAQNGATYEWLDCQNGSVKIPGETGQSFVPQENGEYAVVITMDGCADTSACIMVTGIVGIDEILAEKEVRIYPNPNNGQFRIDFQELVPVCTIQLMTIQGSMIHTESHRNRQEVELNLQGKLAQGTYLLWISFEDGSIRKSKMVIH